MKLFEILTTVLPYTWLEKKEDFGLARFTVGGYEYLVTFEMFDDYDDNTKCAVEFSQTPEGIDTDTNMGRYTASEKGVVHNTNTGNQLPIISTIQEISKDWFKNHPINWIVMGATTPSREKLYMRMLSKLLPNWNIDSDGNIINAVAPNIQH